MSAKLKLLKLPNGSIVDLAKTTKLGSGVWGTVYDIGDGTVLKLSEKTGGIGDGHQKISHEFSILGRLIGVGNAGTTIVPTPIATGIEDGYAYLLMSKLRGRGLDDSDFETGPLVEKVVAAAIRVLRQLYDLFDEANLVETLPIDPIFNPRTFDGEVSEQDLRRIEAVSRHVETAVAEFRRPIHGDFNPTNLVYDDREGAMGVVDFAETCLGIPEDDYCSLTGYLGKGENVCRRIFGDHFPWPLSDERLALARLKRNLVSYLLRRYHLDKPHEANCLVSRLDARLAEFQ